MSDLSLGGAKNTSHWGIPSPLYNFETNQYETHGMVWFGDEPPTEYELSLLDTTFNGAAPDERSLVGRLDPEWTTFRDEYGREYPYKQTIVL